MIASKFSVAVVIFLALYFDLQRCNILYRADVKLMICLSVVNTGIISYTFFAFVEHMHFTKGHKRIILTINQDRCSSSRRTTLYPPDFAQSFADSMAYFCVICVGVLVHLKVLHWGIGAFVGWGNCRIGALV